jgi:hypothetical protein
MWFHTKHLYHVCMLGYMALGFLVKWQEGILMASRSEMNSHSKFLTISHALHSSFSHGGSL